MCLTTHRLDCRLAAGEDPSVDAVLEWRSAHLTSERARGQIARGLRRVLSEAAEWAPLSSVIPTDARALETARPALEQLARAIATRECVGSRGIALTHLLLTEPLSVLYQPTYADQLYEAARAALFALGPDRAPLPQPEESVCLTLR